MIPTKNRLNQNQLEEATLFYSQHLRIEDWDIDVVIASAAELPDKHGDVTITVTKRRAQIRVRDARDASSDCDPIDMEQVLVHELTHVAFAIVLEAIEDEDGNGIALEQSIDSYAWALVGLRRARSGNRFSWERKV